MKLRITILILFILITFTSCSSWLEFDIKRYAFGFIFTLVLGIIGLIIVGIKGGNNK